MHSQTLKSEFSGENTRLAFDTEILLPNYTYKDFDKMSIYQISKPFKRDYLKVGYKIKLDRETECSDRRIMSKILKLEENNQYGKKTMSIGCIKKILHGQNLIFYSVSLLI